MQENTQNRLKIVYEIVMSLLALAVAAIILIDCTIELPPEKLNLLNSIDTAILVVFIADYFTRLILAKDKLKFLRTNIIELIAIIPFNSIFQTLRLARLARLARLLRMIRMFSFLLLFYKKLDRFIKTNNFHYALIATVIVVLLGATAIHYVEDMSFSNALWWAIVTATTVGYGDISPATGTGRVIAVILMIMGIGFLGMLTGTISTFFLTRKEERVRFKNEILEQVRQKLDNFDELGEEDIEDICKILMSLKKKTEDRS